ncbi:MAG: DUF5652 family protein [Patescibacteria group bacterium]
MMPWYLGSGRINFEHMWGAGFGLLALWSVIWTGLALWHAAKRDEKGWFLFFLFVHTAGIIEFVYLMFIVKAFTTSTKKTARKRK